MYILNQMPYPLFSFPPRIYLAARETVELVQVTDIIAGTSCLTALSISVSPLVDWKHPLSGQIRPSVLNQAIAAISGDRKSSADELVCRPIYDRDEAALLSRDAEAKAFARAKREWGNSKKVLVRRINKLGRAGKSTAELEAMLEAHEMLEPVKPVAHRIIYQDMTRVSAFEALEGDGKAIAVMTDEGQTLLDSTVMRHYGFLNHAWEGKRLLTYDRAKHDSLIVQNPRVTVSFMVQPDVLAAFFAKRGKIVQGSGFCARYLFSRSPSVQGLREPKLSSPPVDLIPFHDRISELLAKYQAMLKNGKVARAVVQFDEEAKLRWLQIARDVESDFKPGLYLHDISDFGNKFMDMVGRIACLLYYFEADHMAQPMDVIVEPIDKISVDTLDRASTIAHWHLHEYKAIFSSTVNPLPEEIDGRKLYNYLYRTFFTRNILQIEKTQVRQCCGVRRGRFDPAFSHLALRHVLFTNPLMLNGSKRPTEVIQLNEAHFRANPIY